MRSHKRKENLLNVSAVLMYERCRFGSPRWIQYFFIRRIFKPKYFTKRYFRTSPIALEAIRVAALTVFCWGFRPWNYTGFQVIVGLTARITGVLSNAPGVQQVGVIIFACTPEMLVS